MIDLKNFIRTVLVGSLVMNIGCMVQVSAGEKTMTSVDFMKEAAKEADINLTSNEGGPFGTVIVKDGKIVGRGHNRVIARHDPTCHGEIDAIRNACENLGTHDLTGCELYTNSYPCPMCLGAIAWSNIKKFYYGNTAQDADAIGFRDDVMYKYIQDGCRDTAFLAAEQIGREYTIGTFRAYKAKTDKTMY